MENMIHNSFVKTGSPVFFPEWQGERHYMVPFIAGQRLNGSIRRFQGTIDQMMAGVVVDPEQECYLMVDEKEVGPGQFHRRPGLHVDGYWNPGTYSHGGHGSISCHGESPRESHTPLPTHRGIPIAPGHGPHPGSHSSSSLVTEGLLLASNFAACRAIEGQYQRDFAKDWRGGDCSDLRVEGQEVVLQPNVAYHMDVMTLHESLPVSQLVRRTVVRINVPGMIAT